MNADSMPQPAFLLGFVGLSVVLTESFNIAALGMNKCCRSQDRRWSASGLGGDRGNQDREEDDAFDFGLAGDEVRSSQVR